MPTPTQSIVAGFYAKFTADQSAGSLYDAVGGRWYFGAAPPNATRPFIVCELRDSVRDRTFDLDGEEATLKLTIVADRSAGTGDVLDICDKVRSTFDGMGGSLTGTGLDDYTAWSAVSGSLSGPTIADEHTLLAAVFYTIRADRVTA